jgi:hypothetical protein
MSPVAGAPAVDVPSLVLVDVDGALVVVAVDDSDAAVPSPAPGGGAPPQAPRITIEENTERDRPA